MIANTKRTYRFDGIESGVAKLFNVIGGNSMFLQHFNDLETLLQLQRKKMALDKHQYKERVNVLV
jgi:hypothetical protein